MQQKHQKSGHMFRDLCHEEIFPLSWIFSMNYSSWSSSRNRSERFVQGKIN